MKILFGCDGSPQALAALETLVKSFAYFRETPSLTLIYVHPALPYRGAAARSARRRSSATTRRRAKRRFQGRERR